MPHIKTALISVFEKNGIAHFARRLNELGIEIYSTGGTSKELQENNVPHKQVEELTGFPEKLGGRVKTLHPHIFMGILAKRNSRDHLSQLSETGLPGLDMIVVNLYPFQKTINQPDVTIDLAIEQIDIGGVSLLRAAAKNFRDVLAVISPDKYEEILKLLSENKLSISEDISMKYASDVFTHTSFYDFCIGQYISKQVGNDEIFPDNIFTMLEKVQDLRYGENPHQKAAFYRRPQEKLPYYQLSGKELSYNNLIDIDNAISLSKAYDNPTVAIIKHTNPCGVGCGENLVSAFKKALSTDPLSAFGGIIGCNRTLDKETAEEISKMFVEVVVATDFEPKAFEIISSKKNLRIIKVDSSLNTFDNLPELKTIHGGVLTQQKDNIKSNPDDFKIVTSREPGPEEWEALKFGWQMIRYVKSNAVVYCSPDKTLGIGTGQMSRVDASEIAIMKAKNAKLSLKGSVVISDAFFPFRDGIDAAAKAGATAVIQPGGSIRDDEVIAACEEYNMAMVFTGNRHFRH